MRSFDPRAVGRLECRAWETYYQRRWAAFLIASVGLVRAAFRMSWPRTLAGAWLVLRANQMWAPFPDNDPAAARALMTRFYRLLAAARASVSTPSAPPSSRSSGGACTASISTAAPATRATRSSPRWPASTPTVYAAAASDVRPAAELRAEAMDVSDRWVEPGCDPESAAARGAGAAGALLRRPAGGSAPLVS